MQEQYESLIAAIILQSFKDLSKAIRKLRKCPGDYWADYMVRDVQTFFLSDWFAFLSPLDGEWLYNKMKERLK